jgi:hypothetical protein
MKIHLWPSPKAKTAASDRRSQVKIRHRLSLLSKTVASEPPSQVKTITSEYPDDSMISRPLIYIEYEDIIHHSS